MVVKRAAAIVGLLLDIFFPLFAGTGLFCEA
jgi:hypothetical protein